MSTPPLPNPAWLNYNLVVATTIINILCLHLLKARKDGREVLYVGVVNAIYRRANAWLPYIDRSFFPALPDLIYELQRVDYDNSNNGDRTPTSVVTSSDGNLHDGSSSPENSLFVIDNDNSPTPTERINNSKRFTALETINGQMVNIVKGLKVYEDILMESELTKISGVVSDFRLAGVNGELSGDTYILFNKQLTWNKREILQFGVPMFNPSPNNTKSNIEPIPPILQDLINHLVEWRVIPKNRKPNSCAIYFFDENNRSQPYLKPPYLDNPITSLVLHETTVAFGKDLEIDEHANGDFKGSLRLPLKQGSLMAMYSYSANVAKHAVCPSVNHRVMITFAKVKDSPICMGRPPKSFLFKPPLPFAMGPQPGTGVFIPSDRPDSSKHVLKVPPCTEAKQRRDDDTT